MIEKREHMVIHVDEIKEELLHGGGRVRRFITKETTGANFTISLAMLGNDQGHSWHVHENEDEAIFVISGEGVFSVESDEDIHYKANDALFVRRGVRHQNIGKKDVVLISIFNPAIR